VAQARWGSSVSEIEGQQSLEQVHKLIADRISAGHPRVYEAGGGSASFIPPALLKTARVTVVDIDEAQLARNSYASTKILGDIQTAAFPGDSFDLVVCYNVIEHLASPGEAISHFHRSLRSGGLLFIAAPNPQSFSGWVTKATPHWFHVLYYRHVLHYKTAGQPGSVPFPTVFHPTVRPQALIDHCRGLGFTVIYFREFKGMIYENMAQRSPVLGKALDLLVSLANALVLWRKDLRNGDYHILLAKA
jgi:SAM-dependent methyltransferase